MTRLAGGFLAPSALAAAREAYLAQTGRAVPASSLAGLTRPPRAVLTAFAGSGPVEPWALEGEWLLLELGLKPVLRELVTEADWSRQRPAIEARGLAWDQAQQPIIAAVAGGRIVPGEAAGTPRFAVHVGRDVEAVRRAAELDAALIAGGGSATERRAMLREHGALLGYPACCVDAFVALLVSDGNRAPIAAAAARSETFDARLNVASLSLFHFIAHYPCRFDCAASMALAEQVDAALRARDAARAQVARQLLARPRLYLDDRCQILFDGYADGPDRVRYRGVSTPFAHDQSTADAARELVFFADQVWPLTQGDTLDLLPGALVVRRGGAVIAERPRLAGAIVLPFA